ncbi:pyridoxamine 5'-phosphate oxidase-domain-containing protein [Xylogone sp. PMI_703]|nr:pyridoxamine 5'-phosphate oxidase-domain-containing protein [Xylogone sp. PMI_703]
MRSSTLLSVLLPFGNHIVQAAPEATFDAAFPKNDFRIPTSYESAVMARRILHLTPLATVSTIFPPSKATEAQTLERRPAEVAGMPIGLTEYIADCEDTGNPTLIGVKISTYYRNVAAGSNISMSLQWLPPYPPSKRIELWGLDDSDVKPLPYSAANLPRFSLFGRLEKVEEEEAKSSLAKCFTKVHPDAKYWLPGNDIHESEWVRLVVEDIYFFGGFGDRAYIGWIPIEEWNKVTREEWEDIRLPGEKKGWKEWAIDSLQQLEL